MLAPEVVLDNRSPQDVHRSKYTAFYDSFCSHQRNKGLFWEGMVSKKIKNKKKGRRRKGKAKQDAKVREGENYFRREGSGLILYAGCFCSSGSMRDAWVEVVNARS